MKKQARPLARAPTPATIVDIKWSSRGGLTVPLIVDEASIEWGHWRDQPLNAELLCTNPHYLRWACRKYGRVAVVKLRYAHQAARMGRKRLPKGEGEKEIGVIADILGVEQATVRNAVKRDRGEPR
jgi:hypothetical protein